MLVLSHPRSAGLTTLYYDRELDRVCVKVAHPRSNDPVYIEMSLDYFYNEMGLTRAGDRPVMTEVVGDS